MKRFYSAVTVTEDGGEGFGILLDDRPLNTPARRPLLIPSRPLADEIAGEWDRQGEKIAPLSMPLTQLVNTGLDRVPGRREEIEAEITAYAGTDLLCYRADAPPELVRRQQETWQPLLDWAAASFDLRLQVTTGVLPLTQDGAALAAARAAVAQNSDLGLAALHLATTSTGSLVIGLALGHGQLDADAAHAAAHLDELYQLETWGADEEAEARLARVRHDIGSAALTLRLLAG